MPDAREHALIVFLKNQESVAVKTRIAATAGIAVANQIYQVLTDMTLATVLQSGIRSYLFYDGGIPTRLLEDSRISYHIQSSGDLGQRMKNAISFALSHHPRVVIIGSDCPALSSELLHRAFEYLDHDDLVLGPSADGGYYLLGCKSHTPALFEQISWSSSSVLQDTLHQASAEKLSYRLLETLEDIDTEEDWQRFIHKTQL